MKKEINLENKVKFFAQYWGQNILSNGIELGRCVGDCSDELFLVLKPLSSITDEDAIDIAIISGIDKADLLKEDVDEQGTVDRTEEFGGRVNVKYWYELVGESTEWDVRDFTIYLSNGDISDSFGCANNIAFITDYLRSKGYALPWMGLSVEGLVNAGWLKLQEDTSY